MNIILFFGSFNPIHLGHIIIANETLISEKADELWFVISPQNPFKENKQLADQQYRKDLIDEICKEYKMLKTCDIEFNMPKPSYTSDTMKALEIKYKEEHKYKILIGSDNLEKLHLRKNIDHLTNQYEFLIFPRNTYRQQNTEIKNCRLIDAPMIEISSTLIRSRILNDIPYKHLIHPSTYNLLQKTDTYKHII